MGGFTRTYFDAELLADLNAPILLDILSDQSWLSVVTHKTIEKSQTEKGINNENVTFAFTLD